MKRSLLLLGLALVHVGPALLPGRVFVPLDVPRDSEAWKGGPGERVRVSNSLLSDVVVQFTVWDEEVRRLVARGEMPWVNVFAGDGGPLFANPQTGLFSPFTWPRLLFGLRGWAIASILKLAAAALSMYWLARVLGATAAEAALSGFVFASSGFTILWLLSPHTNVFVFLPALAAAAIERRYGLVVLFAALATAGGHPETLFAGVIGIAALMIWDRRTDLRAASAALGGFLLLGVVLVPFFLLLAGSHARIARKEATGGFRFAAIIGEVVPGFLGTPLRGELDLTGILPAAESLNMRSGGFVGFIVLIAIGLSWRALPLAMKRGLIIGVIALLISFRPPIIGSMVRALPLFGWTAVGYFALIFVIFAAVASGPALLRLRARRAAGIALVALGASLMIGGVIPSLPPARPLIDGAARTGIEHLRARGFLRQPQTTYEQRLAGYLEAGRWTAVRRIALPGLCWLIAGAGFVRGAASIVAGAAMLELLLFGFGWNPAIHKREIAPAPPPVRQLHALDPSNAWLFGAAFEVFPANLGTRYQLRDVVSYDVLTSAERVAELEAAGYDALLHTLPRNPSPEQERALAQIGVRYYIAGQSVRELAGARPRPMPRNVPPRGLAAGILCSAAGLVLSWFVVRTRPSRTSSDDSMIHIRPSR